MKKGFFLIIFVVSVAIFTGISTFAASLTVRDIKILPSNQIEILLDGVTPKTLLELDYVRDIVQFSIQNATIYPAKILHAEDQSFNKIFAYQYSPNLVRVRFSVDGKAEAFKGKVKWALKGKTIVVSFPATHSVKTEAVEESTEKTLLAKVLGDHKPQPEVKPETLANNNNSKPTIESTPLTGKSSKQMTTSASLGGQKAGSSILKSFLSMFLIVGGLGAVLVYVKRKKNGMHATQAKKVGDSWISSLLPSSMRKQKSFIEVMATHALGPKQSIVVVKIRGQQFVLGVTQDSVQLITQIDSDEAEMDLLEDPAVAASIGKMFGGKPAVVATASAQRVAAVPEDAGGL